MTWAAHNEVCSEWRHMSLDLCWTVGCCGQLDSLGGRGFRVCCFTFHEILGCSAVTEHHTQKDDICHAAAVPRSIKLHNTCQLAAVLATLGMHSCGLRSTDQRSIAREAL